MWIAIVVFVLVVAGVIVLNVQVDRRKTRSAVPPLLTYVGSVIAALCVIFGINMGIPDSSTQRSEFKEQVEDRYGVALSYDQIRNLEYPGGRPDGELQTYGATTVEAKVEGNLYRKQKVQLISEDGRLRLATYKDGKGFEELPRKDANR